MKQQPGEGGFGGEKAAPSFAPLPESQATSLKRFLADKGISIGAFADGCGVSKPYMNRLVNGRRDPSLHLAGRMAGFLGISVDKVFAMIQPKIRVYR